MADVETVRHLARGVEDWNSRRRTADLGHPDLTGVKIFNSSLPGLDLSAADLDGAELQNVDLRDACLDRARLNGARVVGTCLDGASLKAAEIKGSDFDRVCLRQADLSEVEAFELRMRRSILTGADLTGAHLRGYTHFYNCDLSGVTMAGLSVETGVVKRPTADRETLKRLTSSGFRAVELANLPLAEDRPVCDAFRIDVPDEQYGVIVAHGAAYWISEGRYDVFISHVSKYKAEIATPLADRLESRGLRTWIDHRRLDVGDDLSEAIGFGIRSSRFGVVVLTPDFFGRRWTDREFRLLHDKRLFLVLHRIEPAQLRARHPGIEESRLSLPWRLGAEEVADRIHHAIRRPPRVLG
ncbi:toll/interleukin-1 receptor domain-containing protein [Amycolatopsis sp. cmx-4-68]|uniref:toll/interleukin-1 receptor domain-containing protein n=1 Tax=Amycolatopsis sp. cmx-4-68 TaxID=2790938 RepID=UPI0039785AB7